MTTELQNCEKQDYQDMVPIDGCHDSFEEYSETFNQVLNTLSDRGVHTFQIGFVGQPYYTDYNGEEANRGSRYDSFHRKNPKIACHMSAWLNPIAASFFDESLEGSEAIMPNDHASHFVPDAQVEKKDYRPYITRLNSSSMDRGNRIFDPFEFSEYRWQRNSLDLQMTDIIREAMLPEEYDPAETPPEEHTIYLWHILVQKRKLLKVDVISMSKPVLSLTDGSEIEWNCNILTPKENDDRQ